MTTLIDVENWKSVATDHGAVGRLPLKVQGMHPINEDVIIRLLISREHAIDHFGTNLFANLDALILSATCWSNQTRQQLPVDEKLFEAHIAELLGPAHAFAAFPQAMGSPSVSYRVLLIDEDQKPRVPTPLQTAFLARGAVR